MRKVMDEPDIIRPMPIRREPRSPGSHSIPNGNFRAIITQTGGPEMPVSISYREFTLGEVPRTGWRPTPENTAVIALQECLEAPNLSEGKSVAREVLARLASGELAADRIPYESPQIPERVHEIDHPSLPLKAIILRWQDEYEIRTIGYVRDGFTLPVVTQAISQDPDYGWGRLDLFERMLADTEEDAISAARAELARLAMSDIPFKVLVDAPRP